MNTLHALNRPANNRIGSVCLVLVAINRTNVNKNMTLNVFMHAANWTQKQTVHIRLKVRFKQTYESGTPY